MEVYLDNSATTKPYEEVANMVARVMLENYGNPSSMHLKGVDAEKYIKKSKEIIAGTLKVPEKEIYFTSGGTESDNWILKGVAYANRRSGQHIITTEIEHPAVLQTVEQLRQEGFEVSYLNVDEKGLIDIDQLKGMIRKETILVSIMHVNNEVGSVQPIEEAAKVIKAENPHTIFHVDAVQGFGKYRIFPKKWGIDAVSVSGHKIHGPKGIGFLYVDDKVKIKPLMYGGGQQRYYRSGTENVPAIAGLGKATEMIYKDLDRETAKMRELKDYLIEGLLKIDQVTINGPLDEKGAPHIVSASFEGIRSEVLLHSLEDRGVFVSSGSACATHKQSVSETLKAMGLKEELLDCTIRFSLSVFTTKEEIEYALQSVNEIVPLLRKYTRY